MIGFEICNSSLLFGLHMRRAAYGSVFVCLSVCLSVSVLLL